MSTALFVGCVSSKSTSRKENAIRVGALLPFTGTAAVGEDIERALILGVEELNQAGGISGRPIELIARDTHGDLERGKAAADELLDDGVVAIIGPEEDDLAIALQQRLSDADVLMVSGGATSLDAAGAGFLRTIPTSDFMGTRIARRLLSDHIVNALIVEDGSTFARSYADAISQEASGIGVTSSRTTLAENQQFGTKALTALLRTSLDSVVVLLQPQHAAEVTQQIAVLSSRPLHFYLTHILRSQALVDNIPPGSLNGAIGISPVLAESADVFSERFRARWGAEEASQPAFFNYDALFITALAIQAAESDGGLANNQHRLVQYALKVASGGTRRVSPQDAARALEAAKSGDALDYRGVSGPVDYDEHSELVRPRGVEFWAVQGDHVEVTEASE